MRRLMLISLTSVLSVTMLMAQEVVKSDDGKVRITIKGMSGSAELPPGVRVEQSGDTIIMIREDGTTAKILPRQSGQAVQSAIRLERGADGSFTVTEQGGPVEVGALVPDFEVELVGGSKVRMSDLRGKVVLLNFWATWCGPCQRELREVQKEVLDRFAGDDFVFLPISRGEEKAKVLEFRKTNNYTFPMGLDPETKVFPLFAEQGIPRSYVINRDGTIASIELGYNAAKGFSEIIAHIEEALTK